MKDRISKAKVERDKSNGKQNLRRKIQIIG